LGPPNFGSPNFNHRSLFTIHYLVLSQVATASVVTARVASGATTALVLGSLQKRPRDPID